MKKILAVMLTAAVALSLAACNKTDEDAAVGADGKVLEVETTPTDLVTEEEDYTPDPAETAANETFITDYAQAAARLGAAAVTFPEEMQIYRVLLVDEDKVQVEFYCNDKLYLGQYIVGLAENPSGLKGLFANIQSAELAGWNVTFEYPTTGEGSAQSMSKDHALAQSYDEGRNVTAWLVDNSFTDLDDFRNVTELFLSSLN